VQRLKRSLLDEQGDPEANYAVGDVVQFPAPDGAGGFAGVVLASSASDGWVEFDFNHPLAGEALRFEVQVLGVL
jgi:FKBP-type peptidyl-prolyl cis-trans isomerase SlpA